MGAIPQNFPAPIDLTKYATTSQLNAVLTDFGGSCTIATLPNATAYNGLRMLVTDLGGGQGYLRASNGFWVRVSTTTAHVQPIAVATTVTIDGLFNSPIVQLGGSAFAGRATITITNPASMPQFTIVAPSGVFALAGSLGLAINGGSTLTVNGIGTTGTWYDYSISADGLTLTKIRGGSL